MKVAYLRVSTEEQQKNETIENQRINVKRVCESRNIKLERIFEDDGVSGTIPLERRPQGGLLLEAAKAGDIREVVIYTWDRLGRDLRDFLNILHRLERLHVQVECISQPTTDDPAGHLMRHVFGAFAQHERERISERTRSGARLKAERGGYNGGFIAFGYRKEGQGRDARLVLDSNPVPGLKISPVEIVKRIFTDSAKGLSCQKIADYLNSIGLPTSKQSLRGARKSGCESLWRPNSVRIILMNPIYLGKQSWSRRSWLHDRENGSQRLILNPPEKVITATCPATIDQKLWNRANAALHANQNLAMAHPKAEYLLRSLIHCGIDGCGCNFTGRGTHYACIGRHCAKRLYGGRRPPCKAEPIRRPDLEAAVWSDIELYLAKPGAVIRQLELQMAEGGNRKQSMAEEIGQLESQKKQLEQAGDVALRQLTRGRISETQFDREVASIDRDKAVLSERLSHLRKLATDAESNALAFTQVRSMLEKLRLKVFPKGDTTKPSNLPFAERRRVVEGLVESVTILPEKGKQTIKIRYTFDSHMERGYRSYRDNAATLNDMVPRNDSPSQ